MLKSLKREISSVSHWVIAYMETAVVSILRSMRATLHSSINQAAFISKKNLIPLQKSYSADFRKYWCLSTLLTNPHLHDSGAVIITFSHPYPCLQPRMWCTSRNRRCKASLFRSVRPHEHWQKLPLNVDLNLILSKKWLLQLRPGLINTRVAKPNYQRTVQHERIL